MSFLIADGVVPSNEDRGYVLRRLMRRAIVQGRRIGIEPGFLPRYAEVVRDTMGAHYGELLEQADTVDMWLRTEEEAFNRTLESGLKMLDEVIAKARPRTARRASAPTRPSSCTTRSASRSTSRSSWPPSAASAWTSRASSP